jgi:hypothetical protein
MFALVGRTPQGVGVYAGVYKFFETQGLPLDILFSMMRDRDMLPCWMSFYKEARAAGMKHERVLSKIGEAALDVWGREFRDVVLERLQILYEKGLLK